MNIDTFVQLFLYIVSGNIDYVLLLIIMLIIFSVIFIVYIYYFLTNNYTYYDNFNYNEYDDYKDDYKDLFNIGKPKEKEYYFENNILEDSENEDNFSIKINDFYVSENSTLCNDKFKKQNIITIDKIINSNTITNIEQLIKLADYYYKNHINDCEKYNDDDNLFIYGDKYYTINLKKIYDIKDTMNQKKKKKRKKKKRLK